MASFPNYTIEEYHGETTNPRKLVLNIRTNPDEPDIIILDTSSREIEHIFNDVERKSYETPRRIIFTYINEIRMIYRRFWNECVDTFMETISYYEDGTVYSRETFYNHQHADYKMMPAYESFYPNGNKKLVCYKINGEYQDYENIPAYQSFYPDESPHLKIRYLGGLKHSTTEFAFVEFYENGQKAKEIWYENGIQTHGNSFSWIEYDSNGLIKLTEKTDENGRLNGSPALQRYENGIITHAEYAVNGKKHRNGGLPAVINYINGIADNGAIYENGIEAGTWIPTYTDY